MFFSEEESPNCGFWYDAQRDMHGARVKISDFDGKTLEIAAGTRLGLPTQESLAQMLRSLVTTAYLMGAGEPVHDTEGNPQTLPFTPTKEA